jgi:diguanylate cyclase (GGDEF)-like protein
MVFMAGPILVLLTLLSYFLLKGMFVNNFKELKSNYDDTSDKFNQLQNSIKEAKDKNVELEAGLRETTVLYEITREICKFLDAEKVFNNFYEQVNRHIKINYCKFIKEGEDLSIYKGHTILTLGINEHPIGYLLADGVSQDDADKFYILTQQFILGIKRSILYQRVQELAITDSLTGVFTRKHFLDRVQQEIDYSKRFTTKFAFLMLDIDHFKFYNDNYGHLVGDAVLREVSRAIKDNLRQIDLMGRYGGEEFSIMLTQTDVEGAKFAAERIRQSLEKRAIKVYDEAFNITISIGISIFPDNAAQAQDLIEKADKALYRAKQSGRNRVCLA